MPNLLNLLFGDPNKKVVADLRKVVDTVNEKEQEILALPDEALREKTVQFKERLAKGETLDQLLPEAFAVVREAARRQLGQRHFDVQLMGGVVLHRGGIAEMRTGEGKTLTATPPLYLNALEGKGCHLVTVNDYLARRDTVWMGQVFYALGMSVGCIQHESGYVYDPAFKHAPVTEEAVEQDRERDTTGSFRVQMDFLRPVSRTEAYAADITYGTNNEFGFDYLRDNMVMRRNQMAQRGLHYAIVDEVDSILIDEARTPLIISAPAEESGELYKRFAQIVGRFVENEDYTVDEKMRATALMPQGIDKLEAALGVPNLYIDGDISLVHHAEQALRAHALYRLDRDYVNRNGEIVIVDEFTGRLMEGRRYSEGLHQAIEAKEGVVVQKESQTLATVTFQNYFRLYKKLAGMTGTAATEAEEFSKIYTLDVTSVPTHRVNNRKDLSDRIYKTENGKFRAIARYIKELHEAGHPVLVGTVSIEKNELLSNFLKQEGVPHEVLNAKNHEREGELIAQAGRPGAVMIATNMAGRGVDIILGGNPPESGVAEQVKENGGLFVIGTERHESRRIDNQLRGRSGRQGDPGTTQFCISMEDDLMRIFGSDRIKSMMDTLGMADDEPIVNKLVSGSIEKAQQRVEGHHFDTRKHLLEYDDVLNKHRELIYGRRREIVDAYEEADLAIFKTKILEIIEDQVEQAVLFHMESGEPVPASVSDGVETQPEARHEILEAVQNMFPLSEEQKQTLLSFPIIASKQKSDTLEQRTRLIETIMDMGRAAYEVLENQFQNRAMLKDIERTVILRSIDQLWIAHLEDMRALRTGIGLRGYGQEDPLMAYKKEAFTMFTHLLGAINEEITGTFFKYAIQVIQSHKAIIESKSLFERAGIVLSGAVKGEEPAPSAATTNQAKALPKVGRNDVCPCGSGKKYKNCHGG